MTTPDYIFESSWEVCNKIGGIYTVLSTKARTLQKRFTDKIIFIGPDFKQPNADFIEEVDLYSNWKKSANEKFNIQVRTGRWNIPGNPIVFLVDFKPFFSKKDSIFASMWESFGVNSFHNYGDYAESCVFAYTVGLTIHSFYEYYNLENQNVIAHFNEWMLGAGVLYLQDKLPKLGTIFTTHATTIGRSIAGNNKPLYGYMSAYNGDQMAAELNVTAKHSLEKQSAYFSDCFTTVSDITGIECRQLLEVEPDIITPNGFEPDFVPSKDLYVEKREEARKKILFVAEKLLGRKLDPNTFLISTSGRYEYRNKGIDVFIDAINNLRKSSDLERETIALIMVPANVYAPRADLKKVIDDNIITEEPLQFPMLTHWLNQMEHDSVMNFLFHLGIENNKSDKLSVIFIPCYLDGADGIFNMTYYDLLIGMDATVYPSYYEPWGYTPLESIAFGIPTITTNLSGFGIWSRNIYPASTIEGGVAVVKRDDENYFEVVDNIYNILLSLTKKTPLESNEIAKKCFELASKAEWKEFISYYYSAYDIALQNSSKRIKN